MNRDLIDSSLRPDASSSTVALTTVGVVIGSPGGRTIINTVLHTIVNVIDYGMNVQEAVDAPRIHQQRLAGWPDLYPWIDQAGLAYFRKRVSQASRDVPYR